MMIPKQRQHRMLNTIIFVISLVLIVVTFWAINTGNTGIPLPVLPPVDTATNPLSGICSTPASLGYTVSPAGFPFVYEVYDAANCKAGINFFAVAMNIIVVVGLARIITAGVTKLLARRWYGR